MKSSAALILISLGVFCFVMQGQQVHASSPAFVQSTYNREYVSGVDTATFGSNVTQNDVIAVGVGWASITATLTSVTSTCVTGNLTIVDPTVNGNQSASFAMAYGIVNASGPCSVTANLSSSAGDINLVVHEISGINTNDSLDASSAAALNYGQTPLASGTSTTSASGDYIFGYGVNFDGSSYTAAPGFTLQVNQADYATEDMIQPAAGAASTTFATGDDGYNDVGMMAFKPEDSGSGAPSVSSFSASPIYIAPSGTSTLSWNVGNASSVAITPGSFSTSTLIGLTTMSPASTTTYTLTATNANGTSTEMTTVAIDSSTPTAPTGLTATSTSSSQISLSWASSTNSGESGIAGYDIFRCIGFCTPSTLVATSSGVSYDDTGLGASITYTYAVAAYNGVGTVSATSTTASTTTLATNYDVYADFESGSNGQAISTSTLNAGTPCNAAPGGAWSLNSSAATQMTVSTAAENPLLGSIQACGTTYPASDGTRGITYNVDDGGTFGAAVFNWNANSNNASDGIWVNIGVPTSDTGYYSMFLISDGTGDFMGMMVHSGQIQIETGANPNGPPAVGTPFNYTADTWYWVTEQFQAYTGPTSMHSLNIYNSSGTLLSAQKKYTATYGTVQPFEIYIGRGGDLGTPTDLFSYDNFIADTTGVTFPVLPGTPGMLSTSITSPTNGATVSSADTNGGVGVGGGGSAYDLSINGGAPETATTSVVLSLYGTGAYAIEVSNTSTFAGATWVPYVTTMPWIIDPGLGTETVYVRFRAIGGTIVGRAQASIDFVSASASSTISPPLQSSATTTALLTAELANLESQLAALQAEANGTIASTTQLVFTRNLYFGITGNDVKELQQVLISQNSGSAARKLLAHGTTEYFGTLTQSALIEFQKKVGIKPASGYFGIITRKYLNSIGY